MNSDNRGASCLPDKSSRGIRRARLGAAAFCCLAWTGCEPQLPPTRESGIETNACQAVSSATQHPPAPATATNTSEIVPALLADLQDHDFVKRETAAARIIDIGAPALPPLRELAGKTGDPANWWALAIIQQIETNTAQRVSFDKTFRRLKDVAEEDAVRTAACENLSQLRRNEIIPDLIAILAEKKIRNTRFGVAVKQAIQGTGDTGVLAMINALDHPLSKEHRANLIWALVRPHAEAAIPALTACLSDTDLDIRRNAISALGQVEDQSAARKLLPFLNDAETKYTALSALERLAKRSFHRNIEDCRAWWAEELKVKPPVVPTTPTPVS